MSLFTFSCLILLTHFSIFVKSDDDAAEMIWKSRTPYSSLGEGLERHHPITFANETHGFLLTGQTYNFGATKDFYMYDESTDKWTDLSNSESSFPGSARNFGYGIVLPKKNHPKAYLGLGVGNVNYLQDFWEFDMGTHSWNQLADFPGLGRRHPAMVPVVINNDDDEWEIHVGLGDGRTEDGNFINLKDWWSYDIQTNTWTQRPDFPSTGRHHPFFFGIGSEAYAGFGHATGRPVKVERDWFHFDPESNEWIEDPDFESYDVTNEVVTTEARVAGTEFSIENIDGVSLGFVLSGDGNDHGRMETGEFHAFCPKDGKWKELPPHPGFSRWAPGSWVMRGTTRAYFTSGYDRQNRLLFSDLWMIDLESLFNDSDCIMEDTTMMPEITSTPTIMPEITSAPTTTSDADSSFAACFSGTSLVTERLRGIVPMKDIRLGDQVQTTTASGSPSWSKVRTFLHWHPNEVVPALLISHTKGNLTLTPNHMLFVADRNDASHKKCQHETENCYKEGNEKWSLLPSHQLQPGDFLLTSNDDSTSLLFSKIVSIQETTMEGYYAPLTASGTLVVDGVLASCYAEEESSTTKNTIIPHWAIQMAMAPLRIWQQQNNNYMPAPGEIHPYAKTLIWLKQQFLFVLGLM